MKPHSQGDYAMQVTPIATATATANATMTSKQIAAVVDKRHDNVKRTIENLANQGVISFTQIEETSHEGAGARPVVVYVVNERDSYVTVAQLCPAETAKLVDYWLATKNQAPAIDLNDPAFLRSTLITYTEKVLSLQNQVSELTEKSDALDRIADTSGLFGVREAAKDLKIRQSDLVEILFQHSWAYRDAKSTLQPYARAIEAGYVTSVMSKPIKGQDGQERVFSQFRMTTKGVARMAQILEKVTA